MQLERCRKEQTGRNEIGLTRLWSCLWRCLWSSTAWLMVILRMRCLVSWGDALYLNERMIGSEFCHCKEVYMPFTILARVLSESINWVVTIANNCTYNAFLDNWCRAEILVTKTNQNWTEKQTVGLHPVGIIEHFNQRSSNTQPRRCRSDSREMDGIQKATCCHK